MPFTNLSQSSIMGAVINRNALLVLVAVALLQKRR